MATTTNYGWTTPDDTALVKDGAAAIRTLGSSVDTTTKNLNPETTLGDIAYRSSTANVKTRLGIGTTGQVLSVSGGVPAWSTISSGGITSLATGTLSGTQTSISSISGSYKNLYLVITGAYLNTGNVLSFRLNGNSGSIYSQLRGMLASGFDFAGSLPAIVPSSDDLVTTSNNATVYFEIKNYATSNSHKAIVIQTSNDASSGAKSAICFANMNNTDVVTEINIRPYNGTSTFSGGTYTLYGVN